MKLVSFFPQSDFICVNLEYLMEASVVYDQIFYYVQDRLKFIHEFLMLKHISKDWIKMLVLEYINSSMCIYNSSFYQFLLGHKQSRENTHKLVQCLQLGAPVFNCPIASCTTFYKWLICPTFFIALMMVKHITQWPPSVFIWWCYKILCCRILVLGGDLPKITLFWHCHYFHHFHLLKGLFHVDNNNFNFLATSNYMR